MIGPIWRPILIRVAEGQESRAPAVGLDRGKFTRSLYSALTSCYMRKVLQAAVQMPANIRAVCVCENAKASRTNQSRKEELSCFLLLSQWLTTKMILTVWLFGGEFLPRVPSADALSGS